MADRHNEVVFYVPHPHSTGGAAGALGDTAAAPTLAYRAMARPNSLRGSPPEDRLVRLRLLRRFARRRARHNRVGGVGALLGIPVRPGVPASGVSRFRPSPSAAWDRCRLLPIRPMLVGLWLTAGSIYELVA
ncbi:hypothetical protein Slala05_27860 [Streptomyces lavendulae subsp. lavendulae]|nr:hypothetical protein Slala05_27860 [Streptomyces lavendulae subsp. lavendulae]